MYEGEHIRIDNEKKRFKKFYSFWGIRFSDGWHTLPEVRRVVITKHMMSQTINNGGLMRIMQAEVKYEMYVVLLMGQKSHFRVEVCKSLEYNEAKQTAEKLSDFFNVKLLDFSQPKSSLETKKS